MSETSERVISGLEGVLACESSVAFIDGNIPELSYRGYNIHDIAETLTYEQVVYLLWHGELPTPPELQAFSADLAARRSIPSAVVDVLRLMPPSSHPMAGLRTAVSLLGTLDPKAEDNSPADLRRKAADLTAKIPTIVAAQVRLQTGQPLIEPDPTLSLASNYYYMVTGKQPDSTITRTIDTSLLLYAEHETNASTFACRVVVGTESDYYSAVAAGIGAIKGPLHGGAIDEVMKMFLEIDQPERAGAYIDQALAARRKIPGFGHRVYRAGDARAPHLKTMAQRLAESMGDRKWFTIATTVEQRMREAKGIIANVDYYAALVLYHLGFPLNMFTNFVASARISGWSAHIFEQYANNRLIRPRALYTGHRNRQLPAGYR
ncbi:MAG TPA: citrate/2-methylcitrate synthase [Alphaproteobacteria bacterium]|nr:citrate/2-methylcitrate synthase [Alphaproteobacteria bacterium]